jgi:hypothetical protein
MLLLSRAASTAVCDVYSATQPESVAQEAATVGKAQKVKIENRFSNGKMCNGRNSFGLLQQCCVLMCAILIVALELTLPCRFNYEGKLTACTPP